MKEIDRIHLIEANRSGVRRRFVCRLAVALCVLYMVAGFTLFFEPNLGASAARGEPERPRITLGTVVGSVTSGRAVLKSERAEYKSEVDLWRRRETSKISRSMGTSVGVNSEPESQQTLSLNETALRKLLSHAPLEFTKEGGVLPKAARQTEVVITLPMPDGTFARFRVEESPVMAAGLAAQFPHNRTYRGHGLDDPTATTRFDVTPAGFHAIVLRNAGTVMIEPDGYASRGQNSKYISYDISDKQRDATQDSSSLSCVVLGAEQGEVQSKQLSRKGYANLGVSSGATLRTYRLALAATAEFTQTFGGGSVSGALSKLTTMTNALNAIYERDLGIHFNLIANETSIIFTNSATDGYTSDNANLLADQNHVVLSQRIGAANYDLGMVIDGLDYRGQPGHFVFQGGAQYQSTCNNSQKGKAYTIFRTTEPTSVLAVSIVAHELGHMVGALHTFNSTLPDCGPSRFPENAYEPGSGSTIMSYQGGPLPNGSYHPLCGPDETLANGTYFHTASIEQITNYTTFSTGSFCPVTTNTGNSPPQIDAGTDYTIPANTPFTLTATGSDADADPLTYCWEQFDLGAPGPPHTDNGNRPIFRSFAPVSSPARTFPQLSDILSGTSTFGESLPTTDRTMTFRVTARDNHPGGGAVSTGAMRVNVVSESGPFVVTQPGSATTWSAGSTQTVTWNVANTSSDPINCAGVRVLLSIDGGSSFPYTLSASVPNTGAATINVPNTPTSSARVKVEAIGNIFFNISLPNFTITANTTSPPILLTEENNRAIALDSVTFVRDPFAVQNSFNFSSDQRTRVMLFAMGLELMPGEDISVVTAQAEDSAHRVFPLTVEYVGKVNNFDWATQVILRLPEALAGAGDVLVSVSLRGAVSNKVIVGIR